MTEEPVVKSERKRIFDHIKEIEDLISGLVSRAYAHKIAMEKINLEISLLEQKKRKFYADGNGAPCDDGVDWEKVAETMADALVKAIENVGK